MAKIDPPNSQELQTLLGDSYTAWEAINEHIVQLYEMEVLWATGGKAAPYEKKYRRGGKTLCALYPRQGEFGFLVVLGKKEQQAFEAAAADFSPEVQKLYQETKVYHDGRWLILWMQDDRLLPDAKKLLPLKRRPNRK